MQREENIQKRQGAKREKGKDEETEEKTKGEGNGRAGRKGIEKKERENRKKLKINK